MPISILTSTIVLLPISWKMDNTVHYIFPSDVPVPDNTPLDDILAPLKSEQFSDFEIQVSGWMCFETLFARTNHAEINLCQISFSEELRALEKYTCSF